MESPKLSKDLEVLIENQASLLYSPTLDFHPKHRNLQVLTFDPSLTKEMCVTKFFRVLDQYYEFHSFGSSSKCILQHNLSDALSDAENKTMNFVNTVLLRFDDVPTSTWNHMHASVINICERIRAVVTHKNKRNFGLYAYRIKNKVEAEFKQSLKDQLYFLFVDEPHTFLTQYYGKNGRDLYLKKFYYHSDVVKITKDTVYLAFIKSNQYASKLNPQKEPDVESSMGFKRYEEDIYIHGDKTVRENRRIIGDFREFVATNRAELEEYLEKNQNQLKQPEVKKGIAERLETSISQVKHVCEVFAVNNSERLKKLYIKHLNNAVKFALHNADLGNEDDYVVMDVEKEEAIEISLLFHQPGVTIINDFETGLSPAVAVENFRRSKFPCLSSNAGASSEQGEDNEEAKKARFE